jgi:hypothetical protein
MIGLHVSVVIVVVVLVLVLLIVLGRARRRLPAVMVGVVMVGVVFVVRGRIPIAIQPWLGNRRPFLRAALGPTAAFATAATSAPAPRTAFLVQVSALRFRLVGISLATLLVGPLMDVGSLNLRGSFVREFEFLIARFAGEIGTLFPVERLLAPCVVGPAALAGAAGPSAARFAAPGFAARFGIASPSAAATATTAGACALALFARRRLGRIRGRGALPRCGKFARRSF